MNVIKSTIVIICLILSLTLTVLMTIKTVKNYGIKQLKIWPKLLIIWIVTVFAFALFVDYAYPFERNLNPILIAEFDVPEKYSLEYPGQKFWHGAYEKFGMYAESFYFDPETKQSIYGFDWPPMNFEKFSYIITYGQKIESLTYNVWETIDVPIMTGAKVGHMILCEDFIPKKVYVYQIPKIRIENDINHV